jgi:hypothetical protein
MRNRYPELDMLAEAAKKDPELEYFFLQSTLLLQ